jgi:hypothetical protein
MKGRELGIASLVVAIVAACGAAVDERSHVLPSRLTDDALFRYQCGARSVEAYAVAFTARTSTARRTLARAAGKRHAKTPTTAANRSTERRKRTRRQEVRFAGEASAGISGVALLGTFTGALLFAGASWGRAIAGGAKRRCVFGRKEPESRGSAAACVSWLDSHASRSSRITSTSSPGGSTGVHERGTAAGRRQIRVVTSSS